jgi:hypothetical protein
MTDLARGLAMIFLGPLMPVGERSLISPIVSVGLEIPQGGSGGGMAWPLNHYLRREGGLRGRVRELAILTTPRELDTSPALELDPRTVVP